MQLKITTIIELALLTVNLGLALAGCQAAAERSAQHPANMEMPHSNMEKANKISSPQSAEPPAKGEVQVMIENFAFIPAEITITPGTKVTWINKDEAPHTATGIDKKFNSGGLDTDDKFSFVFNEKGDYQYFCALHPQMKAIIKVN